MAMVRVYNDNVIDHVENFKGTKIKIPSKGFIEMDSEEAVLFKGQFFPPQFDKGKIQTIESMKVIRVEHINSESVGNKKEPETYKCMKCGHKAINASALKAHIKQSHIESMVDEDAKQEILAEG